MSTEEVQRSSPLNQCYILIYSNSSKSEINCTLLNLNDLLIQLKDYEEGFEPKTKRMKPLETLGFGNFGGFRKYKVQKTSPSLIR